MREYAARLPGDAILLYFFLAAVSDQQGLSFYSDTSIAVRLRLREEQVVRAREDLLTQDLIAYQPPLTQVLALPQPRRVERGGVHALSELFRLVGQPAPERVMKVSQWAEIRRLSHVEGLSQTQIAKRLRCYSQAAGSAITLPEFFSNRYRDSRKLLTWVASLVIL